MMQGSQRTRGCVLAATHARLDDLHTLWHEAVPRYQEPDRFRTFLNSAIQAARNVTFVLQKQKASIPGFADWYAGWRHRLGDDPVMRWIVKARNRVVKAGDLEVLSRAKVSVVTGYSDLPTLEMEVDPLLPLEAIAALVRDRVTETWMEEHGTVVVERQWRVEDLEGFELLDALGHACGVLIELLFDAHRQIGIDAADIRECAWPGSGDPTHRFVPDVQWIPVCMKDPEAWRSVSLRVGSGEWLRMETRSLQESEGALEEAAERYGLPPSAMPGAGNTLRGTAEYFFQLAQIMIQRDGYHLPFAFLIAPDGGIETVGLRFDKRGDKYLAFRALARRVEASRAHAVIFIGEAWAMPLHKRGPSGDPSNLKEILSMSLISREGDSLTLSREFRWGPSGIEFGPVQESTASEARYLDPVRRVWQGGTES